jgi:hypothetical protein
MIVEILTKREFADRWKLSTRTVDRFLKMGLPRFAVGTRRIRILSSAGDSWMKKNFTTARGTDVR